MFYGALVTVSVLQGLLDSSHGGLCERLSKTEISEVIENWGLVTLNYIEMGNLLKPGGRGGSLQ
jgi:hypothetical protein